MNVFLKMLEHQTIAALIGRPKFAQVNTFKDIYVHVGLQSPTYLF